MKFKFDEQGHVIWTPTELYQMVQDSPLRLVNDYLMGGSTPQAFDEHEQYRDFVHNVAERTGVHPRNLYLRGSCQIGFSIAPRGRRRNNCRKLNAAGWEIRQISVNLRHHKK